MCQYDAFGTIIVVFPVAFNAIFYMKILKFLSFFLLFLTLALPLKSQDNSVVPQRTPEQEAVKQTEKLQQELNLTPEQTKQVYEINLRYARERQISNTRSEAVERMKNKNADIQKVLSAEQNERLQTKRYERTTIDATPGNNRSQQVVPSGFRAPGEYRSNPTVRVPSPDMNMRSTFRQSGPPPQTTTQQPQAVRRTTPPTTTQPQSNPAAAPAQRSTQPQQTSQPAPSRSSSGTTTPRQSEPASSSGRR